MNAGYVTYYACLPASDTEHIWRRRLGKGLYRAQCGLLSDGSRLETKAVSTPCELCDRIQRAIDIWERERGGDD